MITDLIREYQALPPAGPAVPGPLAGASPAPGPAPDASWPSPPELAGCCGGGCCVPVPARPQAGR
jgi:hypothetical protein